jgi:hypothetical protein
MGEGFTVSVVYSGACGSKGNDICIAEEVVGDEIVTFHWMMMNLCFLVDAKHKRFFLRLGISMA